MVADTGHGQERHLVDTVTQPVGQLVFRFVTEVNDRALIRHFTGVDVALTQLVDLDGVIVGFQRGLITYKGVIPGYAVFRDVRHQGDDGLVTFLGFGQFGNALDQGVFACAHETRNE